MLLLKGGWPYVDFVEKKPPLVCLFYALSFKIFGPNLLWVHFLTCFWIFLGAIFVSLTIRLFFDKKTGHLGAFLYVLSSCLFLDTEIFATNCEILLNTPLIIGVYFFFLALQKNKKRFLPLFLSGLFSSLSFLFKHQAGILLPWALLSLFYYLIRSPHGLHFCF